MRAKSIFIAALIIVLMLSVVSCSKSKAEGALAVKDVAVMEVDPQSENKIIYEKDKNSRKIEEFVNAFNKAKLADNSLGTTHSHEILITLSNGDKITVWGGTQDFQTVQINGKQFNIKGDELWKFFKKL